MSLSFGYWTVIATNPTANSVVYCRCICGAVLAVELATLDATSACRSCGHRPLVLQQRDTLHAEQARQLTFGWCA